MTASSLLTGPLGTSFYRPTFAIGLIAIALLAVVFSSLATARRERLWWLLFLRIIGIMAMGWVLLGYSNSKPTSTGDPTKPTLTILLDRSASMAEKDAVLSPDQPAESRYQALRNTYLNETMLSRLNGAADVELVAFDEQLRMSTEGESDPTGRATALYQAIAQINTDATLILSDGHDTTRQQPNRTADAGRLFAVPVGTTRSAPDLAIQAWPDSDRLFEDQSTTITATVHHDGFSGRLAKVDLLFEGQPLETQAITLDQRTTTLQFNVKPPLAVGRTVQSNHYTARIRLVEGEEAYPDNNTEEVFIQTTRGQIKVLLLEGEPYWDTRSLARLITRHPRFDLTAQYAFGDDRRAQLLGETIDPSIDPIQQLDTFDIVILGRHIQRLVDPGFADRLGTFVRQGGAVVFARGQPVETQADGTDPTSAEIRQGLEAISPVNWAQPVVAQMRVRVNDAQNDPSGPLAGLQDDEVLTRLPGMLAATRIDGRKAASLVLLEQQPQDNGPAMVAMSSLRVGSGLSLAVLTEGLWRWELLPGIDEQDPDVESIYGVLWVRALQWLASGGAFLPGQDIALEASRLTADLDETINLKISTRYVEADSLDLALTVTDNAGDVVQLKPTRLDNSGTFSATFTPKTLGVYTIALTTPSRDDLLPPGQPLTTRLAVIDRHAERRDTSAKPDLLKQLVEPTGGACLEIGEIQPVMAYLQSLQALRRSEETVDYAFHRWPVFALIAGCFGLEWILRRRMGLR